MVVKLIQLILNLITDIYDRVVISFFIGWVTTKSLVTLYVYQGSTLCLYPFFILVMNEPSR